MKQNPFKFLDSFTKEDKAIFFGRSKEIEEIYSRVFQSNLLLVYGASGTGKTSLIQCGLANKFNEADWLPLLIRRGENILQSLQTQLAHMAITPLKENASLKKNIQSLYLDHFKPIYLLFDQFEELFIFGSTDEIKTFVAEVKKIIQSDLQCKFLFVIRGEYLEHLTAFEEDLPEFFNNRIRIEKMTRLNAAETISGPCRLAGIEIEPGFEQNFLETLSPGKAEVELTYLQVFLDKLFKKAVAKNPDQPVFTNDLLAQIGKISDVLSDFLEEQIARIPDSETALAVLKSFVSMEGTKKQIDAEEISKFVSSLGKEVPRDRLDQLIHQFVDLRILRDKDENGKYELRHDSLAIRIYEKISLGEKELIEVRTLIETAHANYLKRGILINETDLGFIAPYERKLFLNEALQGYLDESKKALSRRKRRSAVILFVSAGILIAVLSGFTLWALSERGHALEQSHEAEKQTHLAEQEMKEALRAKDEAVKANTHAEEEMKLAERNEKVALSAKQQAELARQQAFASMGMAEKEKSNALVQTELAQKAAANAEAQKEIAKSEKLKAEESEKKASQGYLLSLAQGVALKSPLFKDDPQLQGLLALQAYQLNKNNNGHSPDPVIYDALRLAGRALDTKKLYALTEFKEAKGLSILNDTVLIVTSEGYLFKRAMTKKGTSRYLPPVNGYTSAIDQLILSPSANSLITNLPGMTWNSAPYQVLKGHHGLVRGLAFNGNESRFASGGKDSVLIQWKITGGKAVAEKTIHTPQSIRSVVFTTDEFTLFTLYENGTVASWDLNTGVGKALILKTSSLVQSMAFDKVRSILVLGLSNGNLTLADLSSGHLLEIKAHTASVNSIAFNANYSRMASAGSDRSLMIYRCGTADLSPVGLKDLKAKAKCLAFTPDNQLLAACTDRIIYCIETDPDKLAAEINELLKRNMTKEEWSRFYADLPYQKTKMDLP
jgi:hypothetical protein